MFGFSGVMIISIKSIARHIAHERSVGGVRGILMYLATF